VRQTLVFTGVAAGLVVLVVLGAWPFLGGGSLTWLALAGAGAFAVQLALHLGLGRLRRDPRRFFVGVLVGSAARLLAVVAAVVWVALRAHPHPLALLLGLAGFLFGMLLIEASLENSKWYRHLGTDPLATASGVTASEGAVHR
jgi:hypothetical protein